VCVVFRCMWGVCVCDDAGVCVCVRSCAFLQPRRPGPLLIPSGPEPHTLLPALQQRASPSALAPHLPAAASIITPCSINHTSLCSCLNPRAARTSCASSSRSQRPTRARLRWVLCCGRGPPLHECCCSCQHVACSAKMVHVLATHHCWHAVCG